MVDSTHKVRTGIFHHMGNFSNMGTDFYKGTLPDSGALRGWNVAGRVLVRSSSKMLSTLNGV